MELKKKHCSSYTRLLQARRAWPYRAWGGVRHKPYVCVQKKIPRPLLRSERMQDYKQRTVTRRRVSVERGLA